MACWMYVFRNISCCLNIFHFSQSIFHYLTTLPGFVRHVGEMFICALYDLKISMQ